MANGIIVEVIEVAGGKRRVVESFSAAEVAEAVSYANAHTKLWMIPIARYALHRLPEGLRKKIQKAVWVAGFKKFGRP